jgi:hypothetical protein
MGLLPEQETISSDAGSRINGILRELVTLSGAEIALLVRMKERSSNQMMRNVRTGRWALLLTAMAAAIRLSAQAQENILGNVVPTSALIPVRPGAHAQTDNAIPNAGSNVFLTLLLANTLNEAPQPSNLTVNQKLAAPSGVRTPKPKPMTMLSISCYEQDAAQSSQSFLMRCRTEGYLSNATPTGRIVMKGVVTQDVVSRGKILIAAGSKVAGIGHVDPDSGRIESKGDWSIVTENQEVRVHAEAQDAAGGFHGIPGEETSFENQISQRQAVVRDGRYCFLPDKTPFVLSITGEVTIRVLQPLGSSE